MGGLQSEAIQLTDKSLGKILHRGPDTQKVWSDLEAGTVLGHCRLSIFDRTDAGTQPMHSPSGRFVLVYNGEIYNFPDIKAKLEEAGLVSNWTGHSDTEVFLCALDHYGIKNTLQMCHGMFSFALWDRKEKVLSLARDRMGEKPLYYALQNNRFYFSSELNALKVWPTLSLSVDKDAIAECVRGGYIPAPLSLYKEVQKLEAGQILHVEPAGDHFALRKEAYWDSIDEAIVARNNRFQGDLIEARDELERLLSRAVNRQMASDVPLGAFLSGGIDSSLVVALMQAQSTQPIETFTLGFETSEENEAPFAKQVAEYLGTSHNEQYIDGKQALDLVANMPDVYSEPFADPSQIPTYLISNISKQKVTVSLSGDGGDELFAGYGRYENFLQTRPATLQQAFSRYQKRLIVSTIKKPSLLAQKALGSRQHKGMPIELKEMALNSKCSRLSENEVAALYYKSFNTAWDLSALIPGAQLPPTQIIKRIGSRHDWSDLDKITMVDTLYYLGENILTKVDRASMAHSLESRVPMLDHSIVRFAFSLNDEHKVANGQSKAILKEVLGKYIPRKLWERPKKGFGIPLHKWLTTTLRPLVDDLLSPEALKTSDVFDPVTTSALWQDVLSGNKKHCDMVWRIFQVQLVLKQT
ncbi:asparagine synthase [Pseudovibrio sp. JE062]|nr:asparagine synthase [Pseudovibrio sp. JE062]